MKKIIFLFLFALLLASCSDDDKHERISKFIYNTPYIGSIKYPDSKMLGFRLTFRRDSTYLFSVYTDEIEREDARLKIVKGKYTFTSTKNGYFTVRLSDTATVYNGFGNTIFREQEVEDLSSFFPTVYNLSIIYTPIGNTYWMDMEFYNPDTSTGYEIKSTVYHYDD